MSWDGRISKHFSLQTRDINLGIAWRFRGVHYAINIHYAITIEFD